jgi:hypothetical protein
MKILLLLTTATLAQTAVGEDLGYACCACSSLTCPRCSALCQFAAALPARHLR